MSDEWANYDYERERQIHLFWARVRKGPDCWLWQGRLDGSTAYGSVPTGRRGSGMRAHRFSYILHFGPVPEGMEVCHRCDNPPCVRPDHLYAATHKQNVADMKAKGRFVGGPNQPARGRRHGTRTHPESIKRGEQHPNARLTEAAVHDIRTRHAAGESASSIGRAFGMSHTNVLHIIRGRSWRHV